jgi:hypothetical protein
VNWQFAIEIAGGGGVVGALLGLMLSAALPHRADERTRSNEQQ